MTDNEENPYLWVKSNINTPVIDFAISDGHGGKMPMENLEEEFLICFSIPEMNIPPLFEVQKRICWLHTIPYSQCWGI